LQTSTLPSQKEASAHLPRLLTLYLHHKLLQRTG
jgi:hypothetical protein